MAPKAKNVAGSKRNRKGETFGSSSAWEPIQKFGKKVVQRYGWEWFACQQEAKYMGNEFVNETVIELGLRFIFDNSGDCNLTLVREFYANWLTETKYKIVPVRGKDVKFSARILNELLGTPNYDLDELNNLKDKPLYRDIRHTLYGVDSTARLLVYMLMKGMHINVGAIQRQNMMKFRTNLRWRFCYGGLITRFLRAEGIEEETMDMTVAYHPNLTSKLVDVTRTKALDTSHGHILSAQEKQAHDDSVMARMFGMAELQLRIGGRPVIDEEMATMVERYPLTESAAFLCRTSPAFLEPLDDDEAIDDEAMDDEEDDVMDEEANALMVFDHGDDEA
ncbi:hypothetical protein KY289_008035 [Solanum tuberosum]|nr:hypothetical protein KY289_008035 [Solanum tuberosum]